MTAIRDILRKLLRDPSAAVGLLIILLLVAIAILAPLLATHPEAVWDMNPRQRLAAVRNLYRSAPTGWAPTSTAASCSALASRSRSR
jgi:hypothetical protein